MRRRALVRRVRQPGRGRSRLSPRPNRRSRLPDLSFRRPTALICRRLCRSPSRARRWCRCRRRWSPHPRWAPVRTLWWARPDRRRWRRWAPRCSRRRWRSARWAGSRRRQRWAVRPVRPSYGRRRDCAPGSCRRSGRTPLPLAQRKHVNFDGQPNVPRRTPAAIAPPRSRHPARQVHTGHPARGFDPPRVGAVRSCVGADRPRVGGVRPAVAARALTEPPVVDWSCVGAGRSCVLGRVPAGPEFASARCRPARVRPPPRRRPTRGDRPAHPLECTGGAQ